MGDKSALHIEDARSPPTCQVGFTVHHSLPYGGRVHSKVKQLRTERGLSQQQLGAAVGVSRQTINAIETGRYDPSLALAVHLSRYFGFTVEEVFDVD